MRLQPFEQKHMSAHTSTQHSTRQRTQFVSLPCVARMSWWRPHRYRSRPKLLQFRQCCSRRRHWGCVPHRQQCCCHGNHLAFPLTWRRSPEPGSGWLRESPIPAANPSYKAACEVVCRVPSLANTIRRWQRSTSRMACETGMRDPHDQRRRQAAAAAHFVCMFGMCDSSRLASQPQPQPQAHMGAT